MNNQFLSKKVLQSIGTIYAALTFFFNCMVPLGIAGGVPYVGLALIGLLSREKSYVLIAGVIGTLLTIWGLYLSPQGSEFWVAAVNRCLTIGMLWITVVLCIFFLRYEKEKVSKKAEGLSHLRTPRDILKQYLLEEGDEYGQETF